MPVVNSESRNIQLKMPVNKNKKFVTKTTNDGFDYIFNIKESNKMKKLLEGYKSLLAKENKAMKLPTLNKQK